MIFLKYARKVIQYSKAAPFKYKFICFASLLLITFLSLFSSRFVGSAVDAALTGQFYRLIIYLLLLMLLPLGHGLLSYLSTRYSQNTSELIAQDFRRKTFLSFIGMPISKSGKWHSGDASLRFSDETTAASAALTETIIPFIVTGLQVIVAVAYSATISPPMVIAILLALPLNVLATSRFSPQIEERYKELQTKEAKCRSYLQEALQRTPLIKAFMLEATIPDRYRSLCLSRVDSSRLLVRLKGRHFVISNFLSYSPILAYIFLGAYYIGQSRLTVGSFITFSTIAENSIIWPVTDLVRLLAVQAEKSGAIARLEEIWDAEREEDHATTELPVKDETVLKVEDLCFSYDSGERVLEGLCFTARTGDIVAIQGPSGAGKSTLVKLLLGLYEPERGKISVSVAGKTLEGPDLRSQIAYVPQGNSVLSATIYDNIACGLGIGEEDLHEVARMVGILDFVSSLPQGFDTFIHPGDLSEGQSQRIAVARALIRQRPVLLMDEPSSYLDQASEQMIADTIRTISPRKIVICVSHREAILAMASCRVALPSGKRGERGRLCETL